MNRSKDILLKVGHVTTNLEKEYSNVYDDIFKMLYLYIHIFWTVHFQTKSYMWKCLVSHALLNYTNFKTIYRHSFLGYGLWVMGYGTAGTVNGRISKILDFD